MTRTRGRWGVRCRTRRKAGGSRSQMCRSHDCLTGAGGAGDGAWSIPWFPPFALALQRRRDARAEACETCELCDRAGRCLGVYLGVPVCFESYTEFSPSLHGPRARHGGVERREGERGGAVWLSRCGLRWLARTERRQKPGDA